MECIGSSDHKPLPTLPNEIWIIIASFLPKASLRKLYFVCPVLLHLAMDEIYNETRIFQLKDPSTYRCLAAMDATSAARVRTLVLRPHLFGRLCFLAFFPDTKQYTLGKFLFEFFGWKERPRETPAVIACRVLLGNIYQMTNLRSVVVGCYATDSWAAFNRTSAFLMSAWTHAANLQNLTLDLSFECVEQTLSTMPCFPSLLQLSISLRAGWRGTADYNAVCDRMAAFINNQSSTLTHLSLNTVKRVPETSRLYQNIDRLPKAVDISLRTTYGHFGSHLAAFGLLQRHADRLQGLMLRFSEPAPPETVAKPHIFFGFPIFQLRFPELTELKLSLLPWKIGPTSEESIALSGSLGTYLSTFHENSLYSLVLSGCALTSLQIQAIVSVLGGRSSTLRTLELHLLLFNANILDTLANGLPDLRELGVTFESIGTTDEVKYYMRRSFKSYLYEFSTQMSTRVYADWGLRHLGVGKLYGASWPIFRQALLDSLPGVVTFNNLSRREFLEESDYSSAVCVEYTLRVARHRVHLSPNAESN